MKVWTLRIVVALAGLLLLCVLVALALYIYRSAQTNGEIISSGKTREYLLYVPAGLDPAVPVPLVISMHGAFLYPGFQMRLTQWNALADTEGFIVVYPRAGGFPPLWRLEPGEELSMELRFFSDLIDALSKDYNIDPARIYANGYSNGAAMSSVLACNLSHRIAAFGMVATPVLPWDWCGGSEPAPLVAVHGVDDPYVPYEGGTNFLSPKPLLSIREWIALWAARNRCETTPGETEEDAGLVETRYTACAKGASIILYSLDGTGHIWPGGMKFPGSLAGPYSDRMNATKAMWDFFQQHPLPSQ